MTKPKRTRIQPNNSTHEFKVTDDLKVQIIPNLNYEFLMSSAEVAKGYGSSLSTIKWHVSQNKELKAGIHYIKGFDFSKPLSHEVVGFSEHLIKNVQPHQVFWTKAGVVRLGMHINSDRGVLFRDWAEHLILHYKEVQVPKPIQLPPAPRRKHNRLTPERLISIMADVCLIEDRKLRERIASKITGDYYNEPKQLDLFNPQNA